MSMTLTSKACSRRGTTVLLLSSWIIFAADAADWPTFRYDAARSGIAPGPVPDAPTLAWSFTCPHPPVAAWGTPRGVPVEGILELPRVRFDDVYAIVVDNRCAYFASSADDTVYALDLVTGSTKWMFPAGGPIRLAPTLSNGKLFFGADDGCVYCLRAEDGAVEWRFQAGPSTDRLLGHGRMISRWPVRTGVLVDNDVAYFGAGLFPAEGVFLYAVKAASGESVWSNDTFGKGGLKDISPQGYLLASADKVYVPSGRGIPAAFDRRTGAFLFQRGVNRWREGTYGGVDAVLSGDQLFSGTEQILGFDAKSGHAGQAWLHGRRLTATTETLYLARDDEIAALDRASFPAASRKRQQFKYKKDAFAARERAGKVTQAERDTIAKEQVAVDAEIAKATRWRLAVDARDALILAGDALIAGGDGRVLVIGATDGDIRWQTSVNGKARDLAVCGSRILVSTDTGRVYCFANEDAQLPREHTMEARPADTPPATSRRALDLAALQGLQRGFAFVVGAGAAETAAALVRETDLRVQVAESDIERVSDSRHVLAAAGIYGVRAAVDKVDFAALPYPEHFANLAICTPLPGESRIPISAEQIVALLRPAGGTAYIGTAAPTQGELAPALTSWLQGVPRDEADIETMSPGMLKITRRPLKGVGSWTHQYADAANTTCGDDQRVRCPLKLLWFGDPGPGQMVNRHLSAASPLSANGRLFIQGENVVMAYDAYNGLHLWERSLGGARRVGLKMDCSNFVASEDSLFVAIGKTCLRLDQASGDTSRTLPLPAGAEAEADGHHWGYVAYADGMLFGTRGVGGTHADRVFALSPDTGKALWAVTGTRIMQTSIAIGGGRLFYVDRDATQAQREAALAEASERGRKPSGNPDVRVVVAIDTKSGKKLWEKPIDVTGSVKISKGGGELSTIYKDGVVLLFTAPWNGHFWQEFFAKKFSRRSLIALSATSGTEMWSGNVGYRSRPIVVGDTIYAEPWARNLHTGAPKLRVDSITGTESAWQMARPGHHCGCMAASENCLFFRSGSIGYYDLLGDFGTEHFGGIRPGCWINFIPANGVVLVPEASSGCVCPFPIHCTVVFAPGRDSDRGWGLYSAAGAATPVERLGINFGAPGDLKAKDGTVWLAFPRPRSGRLVRELTASVQTFPDGGYQAHDPSLSPYRSQTEPWLVSSGVTGLKAFRTMLVADGDPAGVYTVAIRFSRAGNEQPDPVSFGVKIQGNVVRSDVKLNFGETGTPVTVECPEIAVDNELLVELVPAGNGSASSLPQVNGIRIERTYMQPVSVRVPDMVLNDVERVVTAPVEVTNHTDATLDVVLKTSHPEGLTVALPAARVSLAAGAAAKIPVTITLGDRLKVGDHVLGIVVADRSGKELVSRDCPVRYTGRFGETVVQATADSHAMNRMGGTNKGADAIMWTDGGSKQMEDGDHSLVYMRFPVNAPGRALGAKLRLRVSSAEAAESNNAGDLYLAEAEWDEHTIVYGKRPVPTTKVGVLGKIARGESLERELNLELEVRKELTLVIVPTTCDGGGICSRESGSPPELVIRYELQKRERSDR